MGQQQNLHSGPSTLALNCIAGPSTFACNCIYCTLYAVCTARQSTLALNCLTYLDNLHLRAIVCTVRSAGQSALAHAVAHIMLSPAQRGKEKANFCSDSLSDARRMFVELVL